jgi:hypothetical protein
MHKPPILVCALLCLALTVSLFGSSAARKSYTVSVAAGALDRQGSVITFTLPEDLKGKSYRLRSDSGQMVPLQVDAERRATFVLAELKAGTTRTFRLEEMKSAKTTAAQGIQAVREGKKLKFTTAGRQVLGYQIEGELPRADIKPIFRRGGYIHPVVTPAGRTVTDDYPADHLHHHGVWWAWTKTEFEGRKPDFWNMGDGTGTVEFVALDDTWSGAVHSGFKARHRFVDVSGPSPKTVLNEVWEVLVYGVRQGQKPYSMFDLVSTQECATSSPLVLPEYHYGGVGFRGHGQWLGADKAIFLTSEGKDRSNGHATRARWCHVGGRVDGELVGIAVLSHPSNFRAPQPLRIHPTEPFLCFAPSQLGQWEIAPGRPYVSRYRYIVYDGPPEAAELDRLWNDYAHPPEVTVTGKE